MGLTGQERRRIIRLISQERHKRLESLREASPRDHCKGCGTHYSTPSDGCPHCRQREQRRLKRERTAVPCKTHGCNVRVNLEDHGIRYKKPHSGYCVKCHNLRRKERG